MIFDLGNLLVNLWKTWREDREWQAWLKLILSTIYSGVLGLMGAWGAALIAHAMPWVAFGSGLLGCAASILSCLLSSPQARSLVLSVPQGVVKQYQAEGETVIKGPK